MVLDELVGKLGRLDREPDIVHEGPSAAVAAIFRDLGDGAELFFIRRAEHPKDPWSGHIAFPGGRRDPGDETLLATAIRETREEVGIALTADHLIGRLPNVPAFTKTKRGLLVVAPFVFAVRSDVTVAANHEVAQTLWIPFRTLAAGEGKGTFEWTWEGKTMELPCIRIGAEKHVLWGMTYRMLEMMLEAMDNE